MNTHPAALSTDELFKACQLKRVKRSGPGGQHRNKVETAVIVTHVETGVRAEANERRSPEQNRKVALFRLRLNLALEIRAEPTSAEPPSPLWRERCRNHKIKVNTLHEDFPTLLAEVLDIMTLLDWSTSDVAKHFECSTSQLLKFLKQEPRAFAKLNDNRKARGLSPLK